MALLVLILAAACHCGAAPPVAAPAVTATTPAPSTPPHADWVPGSCEASAVVRLGDRLVIGDNEISEYLVAMGLTALALESVPLGKPVEDIEAVVVSGGGDGLWIVGSQGLEKAGKSETKRRRIGFWPGNTVVVPDLSGCPSCLAEVPSDDGGLNVEGAFLWKDHLWLGLRSPLVDGDALLLELDEPANRPDQPNPGVRSVVRVNLGGLGVRDVSPGPEGGFLIVAGPAGNGSTPHRLYHLSAPGAVPDLLDNSLPPATEGITTLADGSLLYVTDGKGNREPCAQPARWGQIPAPSQLK